MGRPKGSRNKRKVLSGKPVAEHCDLYSFNPITQLITIANGTDVSAEWSKDDRLKAIFKLVDAIHNDKGIALRTRETEALEGQYEILFVEGEQGFELPADHGSAGAGDQALHGVPAG